MTLKRWLPEAVTVLGLLGLIVGWRMYAAFPGDPPCGARVLYDDWINGMGGLSYCDDAVKERLYWSLGVLGTAPLVFAAGWLWAVPRYAPRITTRIPAQAMAWFLLVDLVLIGAGGWFGVREYDDYRDGKRLKQAERELTALVLPEQWGPPPPHRCNNLPGFRCVHSTEPAADITTDLVRVLHGRDIKTCAPSAKRRARCIITVEGDVGGYPAMAFILPDLEAPAGSFIEIALSPGE